VKFNGNDLWGEGESFAAVASNRPIVSAPDDREVWSSE
jgi:hypothetical protein